MYFVSLHSAFGHLNERPLIGLHIRSVFSVALSALDNFDNMLLCAWN